MLPPTTDVCILCETRPGPSQNYAQKIAEFLGANVTFVSVAAARDIDSIRDLVPSGAVLIAHADILVRVVDATEDSFRARTGFGVDAFVYGFAPSRHTALARALSSGAVLGVEAIPDAETSFSVADDQRDWCGPFTGMSVSGADRTRDYAFVEGSPAIGKKVLIRVGSQPFQVRFAMGGSQVVLAASELADLDWQVDSHVGVLPWFSRLVPLMMFLKNSLGNRAWHSEQSQACFIIDDPLLKPTYGCLNYIKFLEATRGQKFSSSIAFIPWNYRRSHKQVANLFSARQQTLSICIHGCDHTRAEFASTSVDVLRGRARLALERMRDHRERSGIAFDDVMIFPQGLFSTEAIEALADCGFIAAVNTNLCPSDKPQVLPLRNLVDVAVEDFADIPLFGRHYPTDLAAFAFDLFLGRPALAVVHHDYFSKGYEPLVTFVKRLNELDSRLQWSSLAAVCSGAYLKKIAPDGDIHVRFFTDRFRLTNNDAQARRYTLFKHLTAGRPVTVNGSKLETEEQDGRLTFSLYLEPGESADIRITPEGEARFCSWKATMNHRAGVLVRRMLCEFRDHHLETNQFLSNLFIGLRSLQTKERTIVGLFRARELKAAPKSV